MKKQITFFITLCVIATLFFVGIGDGSKIVKAEGEVVGNLNSDDVVNTEDMNELFKYLAGETSTVAEEKQADVNGDECADVRDLIRYKRYLTEASETLSGQGTETEPYLISSLADMYKFLSDSQNSNESAGKYYQITEDMVVNVGDAASLDPTKALVRQWNTIGTSETSFAGTLNGDGKTISGIYLSNATDVTNLLGWVDVDAGTVTGLHVNSSYINPTFSATTNVKYEGATVTNSEIPSCEASITTGTDIVFYKAFTDAMDVANTVNEDQPESITVDVVVLNDVTVSARVDISRDITIKNTPGKTVTITRNSSFNNNNMFYTNGSVNFGLEAQRNGVLGELIIDSNNVNTSSAVVYNFNTKATFYMGEYVTIKNALNPNGGALRNVGTAILEGNMTDNVTSRTGGAIYNEGALTINKGTYSGNKCTNATNGGGVIYNKGTVTINGGEFADNTGTTIGAVISSAQGTVTITGGTFSGNTVTGNYGGAIYNSGTSEMSISGATFSGNNALYGGAVSNASSAEMTITDTIFTGNGASKINNNRITGGAIYHKGGAMSISNCTFTTNGGEKIASKGGAVYCASANGINVTGSSFTGNLAIAGGAICAETGTIVLSGVTTSKNYTTDPTSGGGAMHLQGDASASIENCAINNNRQLNYARATDITFANDATGTLTLLDTSFTGMVGCFLSDYSQETTEQSSSKIVYDGQELTMTCNKRYRIDYVNKALAAQ